MTEKKLWNWLRPHMKPPGIHACRIENSVGVGQSDVAAVRLGRHAWIELKVMAPSGKIKFQPTQPPWITKHLNAGGNVKLLVADEPDVWVVPGHMVRSLGNKLTATREQLRAAGGALFPRKAAWVPDILRELFERNI